LRRDGQALIRLLDASPIMLRDVRCGWAEADARCRGLKLHVVYDPRARHPVHFALTSPKVSDIAQARQLGVQRGATYVFDKGYTDYAWWQAIVAAGAVFVTRLKGNARRREVRPMAAVGADILADQTLRVGHKKPRGGADNPLHDTDLREIVVARRGRAPLHLLTNDRRRSASEIADLYKERWHIELFFKWLKQNLKIKTFLGRSENAVRLQLYVALIAFCLLRILHATHARSHRHSATALLARLKVALFHPLDLRTHPPPPATPPQLRPPNPQLAFVL
jgi:putative transposase